MRTVNVMQHNFTIINQYNTTKFYNIVKQVTK